MARPSSLDTDETIMAIREELMEYYKGSCVSQLASHEGISITPVRERSGGDHYYLRREEENRDPQVLYWRDTPLFTMERQPAQLTLHTRYITKSDALRTIRAGVEDFMGKYLMGIPVATSNDEVHQSPYVRMRAPRFYFDEARYSNMQELYRQANEALQQAEVPARPTTWTTASTNMVYGTSPDVTITSDDFTGGIF